MGDREDYTNDEDDEDYTEQEDEDDENLPPEQRRDGSFDYTNEDGIVVPKDNVF